MTSFVCSTGYLQHCVVSQSVQIKWYKVFVCKHWQCVLRSSEQFQPPPITTSSVVLIIWGKTSIYSTRTIQLTIRAMNEPNRTSRSGSIFDEERVSIRYIPQRIHATTVLVGWRRWNIFLTHLSKSRVINKINNGGLFIILKGVNKHGKIII